MKDVKITNVILHILDNNLMTPILSIKELELEKDVCEFLAKHVAKILSDIDLKQAHFDQVNSRVAGKLKEYLAGGSSFSDLSFQLAGDLFEIMKQNPNIPAGDVAFILFEVEKVKYFSLIKLNYKNSFIHYVVNTEEGSLNKLVKQRTTLPSEMQKIEECFIVNLDTFEIKLLERKFEIAGEKEFYLSKYFLQCNSDLSPSQKLKIIEKAGNKVTKKYFDEEFNTVTKLKNALCESLEQTNEIAVQKIAQRVFGENKDIERTYLEEIKKAGLQEEIVTIPSQAATSKKFITQKVKTDSGIEINFPAHVYNNKDIMEFINNPDGTVSILIKNVNKKTLR